MKKLRKKVSQRTDFSGREILVTSGKTSLSFLVVWLIPRNFWITDRVKELIKYKGYQVAPAELEDTLMNHPAIIDVGVTRTHVQFRVNPKVIGQIPSSLNSREHSSF